MYNSLFNTIFNDSYDSFGSFKTDSVKSAGDVYQINLILPGIKRKDLSLKATEKHLSIFLKQEDDKEQLYRKVTLGGLVDTKTISSKLEDGILEITLPKKEVQDSIQIEVK